MTGATIAAALGVIACIGLGGWAARAAALAPGAEDERVCDQAGAQAETTLQLPPGLLRAIGRVESGRRNADSGAVAPWPWTINANGQGRFFDNAATAVAAVRGLRANGTASVDIGCFQVNLMHHPLAFAQVEDGFDPAANATYAGAFLQSLRQRLGTWEAAVAAYHSATPERGEAYRARVYATWKPDGTAGARGVTAAALAPARPVGPVVIHISGPDLSAPGAPGSGVTVWTPSRLGSGPARIAMPAPLLPTVAMLPAALSPPATPRANVAMPGGHIAGVPPDGVAAAEPGEIVAAVPADAAESRTTR